MTMPLSSLESRLSFLARPKLTTYGGLNPFFFPLFFAQLGFPFYSRPLAPFPGTSFFLPRALQLLLLFRFSPQQISENSAKIFVGPLACSLSPFFSQPSYIMSTRPLFSPPYFSLVPRSPSLLPLPLVFLFPPFLSR